MANSRTRFKGFMEEQLSVLSADGLRLYAKNNNIKIYSENRDDMLRTIIDKLTERIFDNEDKDASAIAEYKMALNNELRTLSMNSLNDYAAAHGIRLMAYTYNGMISNIVEVMVTRKFGIVQK